MSTPHILFAKIAKNPDERTNEQTHPVLIVATNVKSASRKNRLQYENSFVFMRFEICVVSLLVVRRCSIHLSKTIVRIIIVIIDKEDAPFGFQLSEEKEAILEIRINSRTWIDCGAGVFA